MSRWSLVALLLMVIGALFIGCQGCATNAANDLRKSKGVPAVIADARLVSYNYTLHGTMRWPLYLESVELCKDDSTRCIIRLFDESRSTEANFDAEGELLPDTLVAGSEVLDTIRQMILDAGAWRFKDSYTPRWTVKDGYSWDYSALFAVTDSTLATLPEARRQSIRRRGGVRLSSGGENASPDTRLFEQIRLYLHRLYQSEPPR